MNADWFDLYIKIALLFVLAGISEILMASKLWKSGLFTTAIFLSIFRRTFLTAIAVYVGLFAKKELASETEAIRQFFMSGWSVVATDLFILITSIGFFQEASRHEKVKQMKDKFYKFIKHDGK